MSHFHLYKTRKCKNKRTERDALINMSEGFQQNFKTKLFKESSSFCIESLLAKKNDENDRKPAVVEKSSPINGIQINKQLRDIYSLTTLQAPLSFLSCCLASPTPWQRPLSPPTPCCPLVPWNTSSSKLRARALWTSTPREDRAPGPSSFSPDPECFTRTFPIL